MRSRAGRRMAIVICAWMWLLSISVGHAQEVWSVDAHAGRITGVAFVLDGKMLATAGLNEVKLWDVSQGTLKGTLSTNKGHILAISPSPDGKSLATAAADTTVRLWDINARRVTSTFKHDSFVTAVANSPIGTKIAAASAEKISLWDLTEQKLEKVLSGHENVIDSLAFSADGKTLASGSRDETVRLWDVQLGRELKSPALKSSCNWESIHSVDFSADGTLFAIATYDHFEIREFPGLKRRRVCRGKHKGPICAAKFSAKGGLLATGSGGQWSISVGFDTKDGFSGEHENIREFEIRLWDVQTHEERGRLHANHSVIAVNFSPDGTLLASGTREGEVTLWDVRRAITPAD